MTALKCPVCGKPLPPSKGSKPRKFCSRKCAVAAWRRMNLRPYQKMNQEMKARLAKRDAEYSASPYAARVTVDCVRTTDGRTLFVETRGQRCIGGRSSSFVAMPARI